MAFTTRLVFRPHLAILRRANLAVRQRSRRVVEVDFLMDGPKMVPNATDLNVLQDDPTPHIVS